MPTVSVDMVNDAEKPVRLTVASVVTPSVKVNVPVGAGVVIPPSIATVAVNVTDC